MLNLSLSMQASLQIVIHLFWYLTANISDMELDTRTDELWRYISEVYSSKLRIII